MNNNFPYNLFNQEAMKELPKQMEEMDARNKLADEIAKKVIVFLDGLTLDEVDHVMMVLRGKCHEKAVVYLEK